MNLNPGKIWAEKMLVDNPGIAGFTATSGAHLAIPISGKPGTSVPAVPAPFEVIPEELGLNFWGPLTNFNTHTTEKVLQPIRGLWNLILGSLVT